MARHGENIRKRKDGRWEARYIHSYDENGKALYRSVYAYSYDEVKAKRAKTVISDSLKEPADSELTFIQVADLWLNSRKETVKISTYNHYRNQLESHIVPDLVNYRFSALTSENVNSFLRKKIEQGYSAATVNGFRTILMMIFRYAKNNRIICNVTDPVFIVKRKKNEVEAFTVSEQKLLVQYLDAHPGQFNLAVLISLYCGLRIGEVCALQWKDILFTKETISVHKTMIRIQKKDTEDKTKTEVVIQHPKTESSVRTLPIPEFMVPILKEYKGNDEYFVITGTEHYMEPRVCLRKFKRIIAELGFEEYTFHACRHTFATRCVEVGVDAKTLSELLGHASVKTTLDRYVHPSIDLKKQQVNKLGGII